MEQKTKTKTILNKIRKAIPTVFLVVYIGTWLSLVMSLNGVISGDEYLSSEFRFNTSKLTAYVVIGGNLAIILFTWMIVRMCVTPDATHRYRIKKLEREVEELNDRLAELESRSCGCDGEEKEKEVSDNQIVENPQTNP